MLTINGSDRDIAITPDGSRVVYVGNRGTQLFVRALDAIEPVAVFTGAPREPFVSPDSQWIGFVDNGDVLKKVAVTGGPAVTLGNLDSTAPRGATWGPEDTIIVATANGITGLQQVAAGASTRVLTRPDREPGRGRVQPGAPTDMHPLARRGCPQARRGSGARRKRARVQACRARQHFRLRSTIASSGIRPDPSRAVTRAGPLNRKASSGPRSLRVSARRATSSARR